MTLVTPERANNVYYEATDVKLYVEPGGALMLDHLGLHDQAARLHKAVDATTGSGVLTRDVGGTATTAQVTAAIIDNLAL